MQLKDAKTLAEFECSASFTQHAKSYPAFLHLKANELTWTIRGTDITSRLPYSCVYGYEAPDLERLNASQHDLEDLVKNTLNDRLVTLHFIEFTTQDLKSVASPQKSEVCFLFQDRKDVKRFLTLARELQVLPKPRRLLLIVNPNGGVGLAKKTSDTVIKPMMRLSGLTFKEQYTEYGKHAVDIAHKVDLDQVDALIVVSGDGVLHEVVNGLLTRPDWERARRLPVGIIPAGSGNAFATSVGTKSPYVATLAAIRGTTAKLDIFSLSQLDRPRIYSMLLFSWGMMADADIESDKYRWLGPLRFDIAGVIRAIRLRRYPGKVYVLPPKHKREISSSSSEHGHAPVISYGDLLQPSVQEPPKPWRLLPSMPYYTMLLLLNCSHAGEKIFFTNTIRFNDGIMRLWYSCETRFWKIILPFMVDQTNGKLIHRGLMQDTECGGILIVPGVEGDPEDPNSHEIKDPDSVTGQEAKRLDIHQAPGVFDVDGEVMPTARLLIEILPSFMEILVPEWFHHEEDPLSLTDGRRKEEKESPEAVVARQKKELVQEVARTRQALENNVQSVVLLLLAMAAVVTAYAIFFSEPFQLWAGLAKRTLFK
ncbi:sphingosine kinase [Entomortierella parvispora]|uniref:Sphingosine kinase n=1 Tax=Entomortierella parvispora TaxID=205924 RepID=A0A9P3H2F3_9FUNG|nr:sphingosine kinase [Entomortierella parvispora]